MSWLGYGLTVLGFVLVVIPLVAALWNVTVGGAPSMPLDRAATFILGGIACFATGIAMRQLGWG